MFVVRFINVCCIFASIAYMLSKKAKGISEWALENGRQNTSRKNPDKSLKRRTVRDQATLIKGFLNDAVVQGIIATNPADKVEVPRVREDNVTEKAYMDKGQAEAFLAYVKSEPMFEKLYCFTKLGLYYGLRRSELLGLKWGAIDFMKDEITINHTVVRGEQGDVCRDNVKTKSSHRYLPLLESVKADLLDLMESQKGLGIYSENGYVFTWEDGRAQRHKRDGEHLQPCKQEVAEQTWCDGG